MKIDDTTKLKAMRYRERWEAVKCLNPFGGKIINRSCLGIGGVHKYQLCWVSSLRRLSNWWQRFWGKELIQFLQLSTLHPPPSKSMLNYCGEFGWTNINIELREGAGGGDSLWLNVWSVPRFLTMMVGRLQPNDQNLHLQHDKANICKFCLGYMHKKRARLFLPIRLISFFSHFSVG